MLLLSGNVPEESNQGEVSAKYSEGNIGETSEKHRRKHRRNIRVISEIKKKSRCGASTKL